MWVSSFALVSECLYLCLIWIEEERTGGFAYNYFICFSVCFSVCLCAGLHSLGSCVCDVAFSVHNHLCVKQERAYTRNSWE